MELLTYSLENRGKCSLYEYLYRCIKEDIISGKLKGGDRLPSKRVLASHLGVGVITVENAYGQLLTEGYINTYEKKGYYIEHLPELKKSDEKRERYDKTITKTEAKRKYLVDFTANVSPEDSFPFDSWSKIMRRVLLDNESSFSTAPDRRGEEELRVAIADYLYESKGMQVNPERIIVGPGTEYLHHILIQLMGRNYFFATENPGYKKVGKIYEADGVKVIYIPVDENGMKVELLEGSNVHLVHVSPSHHFPTGAVLSAGRRHRLLEWAKEQDSYIIEDDYDSVFRFEGRPIASLYSMNSGQVIYMSTFTKTLAASIRIAYMVLPDSLYEKYEEKLSFMSATVSSFEQKALAIFINEGYFERHIRRMKARYREYRKNLLEAFALSGLDKNTEILDDKAGLSLVVKIPGNYVDKNLINYLDNENVKIGNLELYCYKVLTDFDHIFLMSYNGASVEELTKALTIIAGAI